MRLLQITNYVYPHIGGIEQVTRDIADSLLHDKTIEQKIICFNEDAQDGEYICHRNETVHDKVDGIEVVRCGCFTKIFSQSLSVTYINELRKILCDFNPDVVIFHYPNPFVASFFLPMLSKRTKLILWWHLDITKQKVLGRLFRRQSIRLLERANQIVATSPLYIEGSRYLKKYKNKCISIPNCIRPERFADTEYAQTKQIEIRKKFKDKIICFAVGRHVPYKGMHYLIQASKYLDDSFVVLIGGDGVLTSSLKEEAKDDNKISFLGRIPEEDMVAYYKACDIFCFPSITKNEAFGLALAEGMYFGKPAVTFTISGSGVNYVCLDGEDGIEVPNRDVKAYAEALKKLANDPAARKKMGLAGKKRVEENFLNTQFKDNISKLMLSIESK